MKKEAAKIVKERGFDAGFGMKGDSRSIKRCPKEIGKSGLVWSAHLEHRKEMRF